MKIRTSSVSTRSPTNLHNSVLVNDILLIWFNNDLKLTTLWNIMCEDTLSTDNIDVPKVICFHLETPGSQIWTANFPGGGNFQNYIWNKVVKTPDQGTALPLWLRLLLCVLPDQGPVKIIEF